LKKLGILSLLLFDLMHSKACRPAIVIARMRLTEEAERNLPFAASCVLVTQWQPSIDLRDCSFAGLL